MGDFILSSLTVSTQLDTCQPG